MTGRRRSPILLNEVGPQCLINVLLVVSGSVCTPQDSCCMLFSFLLRRKVCSSQWIVFHSGLLSSPTIRICSYFPFRFAEYGFFLAWAFCSSQPITLQQGTTVKIHTGLLSLPIISCLCFCFLKYLDLVPLRLQLDFIEGFQISFIYKSFIIQLAARLTRKAWKLIHQNFRVNEKHKTLQISKSSSNRSWAFMHCVLLGSCNDFVSCGLKLLSQGSNIFSNTWINP